MAELESLVLSMSADTSQIKRALERLTKETRSATDQIEKEFTKVGKTDPLAPMTQKVSRSLNQVQNDARNLTFQLNDVVGSLMGGASPFMVMSQQGSQVTQIISGAGGITASLKGVGLALSGLLSPTALVINGLILGFGYALSAAMEYFNGVDEGGKASTKAIEAQRDAIRQVANEWGAAYPALKKLNDEMQGQEDSAKKQEATAAGIEKAYADVRKAVGDLLLDIVDLQVTLGTAAPAAATALGNAYDELKAKTDANSASADDLRKTIAALKDIAKTYKTEAADLLIAALEAEARALDEASNKQRALTRDRLADLAAQRQAKMFGPVGPFMGPEMPTDTTLGIGRSYQQDAINLNAATAQISQATVNFIKAKESFVETATRDMGKAFRVGWWSDTVTDEAGRYRTVTEGMATTVADANRDLARRIVEAQDEIRAAIGGQQWASMTEQQQTALTSIVYNYGELPKRIIAAINSGGGPAAVAAAIDALGSDNEGINRARRHQEAELYLGERIASEKAVAAATTATTAAVRGKTAADMAAMDASGAYAEAQRERALAEQRVQQVTGIAKTAVSGFVNDLRNGVEAGDAFRNVLDRVIDGLINMAVESLFTEQALGGVLKTLMGGFSGPSQFSIASGGGIGLYQGGGTVGMSGRNDGRSFSPALWQGAQKFGKGGLVLRPGEVPIIAHRGEVVVPAMQAMRGGRGGGGSQISTSLGDVNIDMSETGMVTANNNDAKQFGLNVQRLIQAEMVSQSRPGGLLRRVPG